ncbi:hypothetical protein Tco_0273598 [Tanacetum coccineum]
MMWVANVLLTQFMASFWENVWLICSKDRIDAMLENGHCVPVWVEFHDVPITAFSKDGLSVIAIKLSYARDMIELRADVELKDIIVVVVPKLVVEGKSSRMCILDKLLEEFRQEVSNLNSSDALNTVEKDDDLGTNGKNSKLDEKEANDMVSSSHATSSKAFGSPTTTLLAEMIIDLERQTPDGKLVLVDDDGKSLKKVNDLVIVKWKRCSMKLQTYNEDPYYKDDFDDCGLAYEQMRFANKFDISKDADHCSKNVKRKSSLEPTTTVLLAKNTRYY